MFCFCLSVASKIHILYYILDLMAPHTLRFPDKRSVHSYLLCFSD